MIKELKPATDLREWHRWFAWYPVEFEENGKRYRVWLEFLDRKLTFTSQDTWPEYRLRYYYF